VVQFEENISSAAEAGNQIRFLGIDSVPSAQAHKAVSPQNKFKSPGLKPGILQALFRGLKAPAPSAFALCANQAKANLGA